MKKLYFFLFSLLISGSMFGQDMVITGAFDGPLTGGTPKLVEIYVINDIPDLSLYGFGSANNGGGTDGEELTFAGSATAGQFIYLASEGSNPGSVNAYFGVTADYLDSSANVNGDDALELFFNGSVIDTYGVITVDGNGEPWEYLDGWAYRVDGTGPDGTSYVQANWTYSGANAVDNCTDNGTCASVFPIGTYSGVPNTDPTITITAPSNNFDFAPGTTSVNVEWTTSNLVGGETVDISVNGSVTNNVTSPFPVPTADGQSYSITVTLVNGGPVDTSDVTFNVLSATVVNDIATLRAGTNGTLYELDTEVFLTYQQSFRNQKFIEDATGAILIDDTAGNLSTSYSIGDGISGILGTLGEFNGQKQFVPFQDAGAPSSTGNTLTPQAVTLAMLTANPESYESELVTVTGVLMDNSLNATFVTGTEYGLTQGPDSFNFRTSFFSADYIGATVPVVATDITGIITERSGPSYFITARDAADFSEDVLSVGQVENNEFSVYPNPTVDGFVNIISANNDDINVTVYDILGKEVLSSPLYNNRLNVSSLNTGVYILRITQNNASVTKKLVIR